VHISGNEASGNPDVQNKSSPSPVANKENPAITPLVDTGAEIIISRSTSDSPSLKDDAGKKQEVGMVRNVQSDESVSPDKRTITSSIIKHEVSTPKPTARNEGVHSIPINAMAPVHSELSVNKLPDPKSEQVEKKKRGGNSPISANILYDQFIQEMSLVALAALVLLGVLGLYRRLGSN
jgi:hypothetical protein